MLVTRLSDTRESSRWPFNSYKGFHYDLKKPRMSERSHLPPPVEPDWPGQYSSLTPQNDEDIFSQQGSYTNTRAGKSLSESGGYNDQETIVRREGDQFSLSSFPQQSKLATSEFDTSSFSSKYLPSVSAESESLVSESFGYPRGTATAASTYERPHAEHVSGTEPSQSDRDDNDNDDADDNDRDNSMDGLTAAERLAARRKMKRFRLTHQQTRFLMSEFAKQPHPDAAHRERLSREIPGLSPRQVQVWFQNRRAKIKRLTADDRDRMVRMRAVPDDFDNIQALHSPYGAVQAAARPLPMPSATSMLSTSFVNDPRHQFSSPRRLGGDSFLGHSSLPHNLGGINLGQPGHLGAASSTYHDNKLGSGTNPSTMHTQDLGSQYSLSQWTSNSTSLDGGLSHFGDRHGVKQTQSWIGRDWNTNHRLAPEQGNQSPRSSYNPGASMRDRQHPYGSSSLHQSVVGLSPMDQGSYSDSQSMVNRETGMDNAQGRVPTRSTPGIPPVTFDFGFRDAYRTAGIPTSSPQIQARRQQASPEATRTLLSPTGTAQGYSPANSMAPLNSPLSSRSFHMPPNHSTG